MPYASVYPLVTTRALARPFTYEVDEGVGKGAVVSMPLGRSKVRGVVVGEEAATPEGVQPVPVTGVVDEVPPALVDLALWVAEYYGSTPARALSLVAPPARARRGERRAPAESHALAAEEAAVVLSAVAGGRGRADRGGDGCRRRPLPALGRDGERQDRGVPPRLRGGCGARPRRHRSRPGDRAHAADARPLPRAFRRPRGRAPLRPRRRRSGATSGSGLPRARRESLSARARLCSRRCAA